MPGNPKVIGQPHIGAEAAAMQWSADFKAHKAKQTNTGPGIFYMLQARHSAAIRILYDKKSPLVAIGPHWMIMWPFDPNTTGLPTSHKAAGAHIV